MTLRTRLALLSAATAAAASTLIASVLFVVYFHGVGSRADADLVAAAGQADQLAASVKMQAEATGKPPALDKPLTLGEVSLELFPDGIATGMSTAVGPLTDADVAVARRDASATLGTRTVNGAAFRIYTMPMAGTTSGIVRASWPIDGGRAAVVRFALLLIALVVSATLLAGLLGRVVAGRALLPLSRLTRSAEEVTTAGDLGRRLDDSDGSTAGAGRLDEVGRLTSTINSMLAALQQVAEAQRQLVADASHELRTPLTSLRTDLDLLCDPPGLSDPDAPALVQRARRRTVELTDLVADLVRLARYGRRPQLVHDVRLDAVVESAAARLRDRAEPRALTLDLEPTLVSGDEEALHRAVSNLLDNAVAWTPVDGDVAVTLRDGKLTVSDSGPGIPERDLPHIFDRFYRSASARSRPGSGLGLAIVKQVAEQHEATVAVESNGAGTTFSLTLKPQPIDQD
jgi:two-component system sensor histidine kinase MprB